MKSSEAMRSLKLSSARRGAGVTHAVESQPGRSQTLMEGRSQSLSHLHPAPSPAHRDPPHTHTLWESLIETETSVLIALRLQAVELNNKVKLSHGVDSFSLLTILEKRIGVSLRALRPRRPDRLGPEIINSRG